MSKQLWQKRTPPEKLREDSSSSIAASIPEKILEILFLRGLQSEDQLERWLSPKLQYLSDPSRLKDLDRAVERFLVAYEKQEKICVYADFDLDGTSGAALLFEGLKSLGFTNATSYQPRRLSQGYGVHGDAIREIYGRGARVLVTVDVGTTAHEALNIAQELGMDVIVTDHHLPSEVLPPAYALINPNQKACASELGHLSGCGVAFYFLLGLKRAMKQKGWLSTDVDLKVLLDFFVIGTITDMVPLIKENRVLVRHGLEQLRHTKRPGLKHLLQRLDLYDRPLLSHDVAMTLAPKLNSLSRMDMDLLPLEVMLAETDEQAADMIEVIFKTNDQRRALQVQAERSALEIVTQTPLGEFVWVYSPEFHKGIIGLVATKLAQTFKVPAFVGHVSESGIIHGSGRLPEGSVLSLVELLHQSQDVLEKYGGHAQAAGFSVKADQGETFRERLLAATQKEACEEKKEMVSLYDIDCDLDEITPEFMKWYRHLEPFGSHFPAPTIRFSQAAVKQAKILKGGHLKLKLAGAKRELDAIFFRCGDLEIPDKAKVDVLGQIQWNHYNGQTTPQLLIHQLRLS
ncbi:MAG: single-stranded-DNA-specific exonuclease RecJ [Bdellovibrionales bacterium]